MFVRRLALLVAGLCLATAVLWGAMYAVLVRELLDGQVTPPSSELTRELRLAEPWSFVDEAVAHPRVRAELGADAAISRWGQVQASPGRLEVVAWVQGHDRSGLRREGQLRIVAEHYWGFTVDDTAWGWQYPVVELRTGHATSWSFPPPVRLVTDDPEGPRRW